MRILSFIYLVIALVLMNCGGASKMTEDTGEKAGKSVKTDDDKTKDNIEKALDELGTIGGASKSKDDRTKGEGKDDSESKGTSKDKSGTATGITKQVTASGLKAGFADDNRQYNYFTNFLEQYR